MAELDTVRDLAEQTLTVPRSIDGFGNCLWDRAQRLVRNVERICQLPEISKANLQIDLFCLITAAYFSDAGLAEHLKGGNTKPNTTVLETDSYQLLDSCTQIVEQKLERFIERPKIDKISRIITEGTGRLSKMTEAMVLCDARNLDDMGAVGIFNEIRRYIIGGKNVSDALKIWKRKKDYQYWQARLREGFRFESVRKLAEYRLRAAEYFMKQLRIENTAGDIDESTIYSLHQLET